MVVYNITEYMITIVVMNTPNSSKATYFVPPRDGVDLSVVGLEPDPFDGRFGVDMGDAGAK